jgi:AraC family transcriptional regulator
VEHDSSSPRPGEQAAPAAGGLPGAALRRVLEHIDANCHRDLRLAELSALAHMSAFHFARLFKRSTGLSPHRFVVERRIERAKARLVSDRVSIAAIAQAVGFRTPSHFTTAFRRSTGVTPSTYRSAAHGALPDTTAPPVAGIESDAGVDSSGRGV